MVFLLIADGVATPSVMRRIMGDGIVRVEIMCVIRVLSQCIIFLEAFIMPMPMASAICADIGLKDCPKALHGHAPQLAQHIDEHWVVFELQEIFGNFQRHMAIAQVISGARKMPGGSGRDSHDVFEGCLDQDVGAAIGHQHVAIAQRQAFLQRQANFAFGIVEPQSLAVPSAFRESERYRGRIPRVGAQCVGASYDLGRYVHVQNRK
jgi:hypothetical protein